MVTINDVFMIDDYTSALKRRIGRLKNKGESYHRKEISVLTSFVMSTDNFRRDVLISSIFANVIKEETYGNNMSRNECDKKVLDTYDNVKERIEILETKTKSDEKIIRELKKENEEFKCSVLRKETMIASMYAERKHVLENCHTDCKDLFDGQDDDVNTLIKEWEAGLV